MAERLGADAPACIEAAITKVEHELRAVPRAGKDRAEWATAIDERLRRLAVKVLPTAKAADSTEWRSAMVDALADLPAMISLSAAKRAIHRPFRFIGEIEAAVREIAAELMAERQGRLAAFRRHRDAIDRALNPPAPLLAGPDADAPLPAEEVERVNGYLRRVGVQTRIAGDGTTYQATEPPVDIAEAA